MTNIQVRLGIMLYILLQSIDPKEQGGKRGRKAMSKSIKKRLMVYASQNTWNYNKLYGDARTDMMCAKNNLVAKAGEDAMHVNPATLINTLKFKYPEHIDVYELSDSHIKNMDDYYRDSNLGFNSMQYANELIKQISWENDDDTVQTV